MKIFLLSDIPLAWGQRRHSPVAELGNWLSGIVQHNKLLLLFICNDFSYTVIPKIYKKYIPKYILIIKISSDKLYQVESD